MKGDADLCPCTLCTTKVCMSLVEIDDMHMDGSLRKAG